MKKLLSKSLLVLLLLVCSISATGMTAPAEDFADPYVPVVIRQRDLCRRGLHCPGGVLFIEYSIGLFGEKGLLCTKS